MSNIPCVNCKYVKTEIRDIDIPTRTDNRKLAEKPVSVEYICTALSGRWLCKQFQEYLDTCGVVFDTPAPKELVDNG